LTRTIATNRFFLLLITLFLTLSTSLLAQQIVFEETFDYADDADFINNSPWSGDLEDFTLVTENGNQLLRLNADASPSRTQIRTESSTAYGEWEFFIRQNANTSTQNRVYVFLTADNEDLNRLDGSPVNGYAIHTGGGFFDLVRVDSGDDTVILTSNIEFDSGEDYEVRVTRNNDNEWRTFVNDTEVGVIPEGGSEFVIDDTYTTSEFFGIFVRYSSTQTDQYFFDNILISEETDEFLAESVELSRANQLDVTFNNDVDGTTVLTNNFNVDQGVGNPSTAEVLDEEDNMVRLIFSDPFESGDYTLTINNLEDEFGQEIEENAELFFSVTNPFDVESITAISSTSIEVEFTEAPDGSTLLISNFTLTGDGVTGSVQPESINHAEGEETVTLNFSSTLSLGDYELTIDEVLSEFGWPLRGDNVFNFEVENPFFVDEFEILSRQEFDITFSQDVQAPTVIPANFDIPGAGLPETVQLEDPDRVRIIYDIPPG